MEIGKAFTFPFEDQDWVKKLAIGILIMIVPILNFAGLGYLVQTMRNVMQKDPVPLPTWDDIGKKFMDGLILGIAVFIYQIPAFVVGIPFMFLNPAILGGENMEAVGTVMGLVSVVLVCCFSIYILFISLLMPAIQINYAKQGTFGSCFQFGEIFAIASRDWGKFLTAWIVVIGASFGIGLVAAIPCLGQLVALAAGPYLGVAYAHLFGQFASAT